MIKEKGYIVIREIDSFRDGGTIIAEDSDGVNYYIDGRIGSETKGKVYSGYPGKEGSIIINENFLLHKKWYIHKT